MSEPVISTGKTKPGKCHTCGAPILRHEAAGLYGSGSSWLTSPHNAPCGVQCLGGGIRGRASLKRYRAGEVHGSDYHDCPKCDWKATRVAGGS